MSNVRAIAFHLPQYHPTPENDEWWGKGFTEWTNVAKAKPLYHGHYQPHLPADLGFYDLRLPEARHAQAELAREYGIEGFCYYHYWFGGRRILERPVNEILSSREPDFPFCLCWANHSWNNIWQGVADRTLIEQTYPGLDDHTKHFEWLLNAFSDSRYIKIGGKPLFLIYNPSAIPDVRRVMDHWRNLAERAGLEGLHLVAVNYRHIPVAPSSFGMDASTWQPMPPKNGFIPWKHPNLKVRMLLAGEKYKLTIYDYAEIMDALTRQKLPEFTEYPTVLPNWDNTPRSGLNGLILKNSRPDLFKTVLRHAIELVQDYPLEQRIVFIKAWNEWAEGNYLEPDQRFGHGYLRAVREALQEPLGHVRN